MDEQEKIQKIREIRLIVTEVLMFLSVILLVGFLTLIVMGYSFNFLEIGGEGEVVERTGLLQISSLPTGATIAIDGGTPLLLRTNASRTVLAGEHEITLSRDGFDAWTKTVNVTEGMMYRVNYPRIFLTEREVETVSEFKDEKIDFESVSPNQEKMILLSGGSLYLLNLNSPKDMTELTGLKVETIEEIGWSGNSERLLAKINGKIMVLYIKNPLEIVDITEIITEENGENAAVLSADESSEKKSEIALKDVKFESESGDKLLVLTTAGELREVNIREKKISEPYLENVIRFDNDGERVIFLTSEKKSEEAETIYQLKAYRVGAEEAFLERIVTSKDAKIVAMKYFQDFFFAVVDKTTVKIYTATVWPEVEDGIEKIFEGEMSFEVAKLAKRGKGMVFSMENADGTKKGVFDIEALKVTEFEMTGKTGWIDEFLRYEITDEGELKVRDYDGLNEKLLVEKKTGMLGVDKTKVVTISGNSRYLYYFSGTKLLRERIN